MPSFLFIQNLGIPEIGVILLLALLIFGPTKLPEIGRSLGRGVREFKRGTKGFMESIENETKEPESTPEPLPRPEAKVAASPPSEERTDDDLVISVEEQGDAKQ